MKTYGALPNCPRYQHLKIMIIGQLHKKLMFQYLKVNILNWTEGIFFVFEDYRVAALYLTVSGITNAILNSIKHY